MYEVDTAKIKNHINETGLKQKVVAQKSGIPEAKFSLILHGKRKCEAGEYASLCKVLGVNPNEFMQIRSSDKEIMKV